MGSATQARARKALHSAAFNMGRLDTGGLRVSRDPNLFQADDLDALGHLYTVDLPAELREFYDGDALVLDDRKPVPLMVQLAIRLRRMAAYCKALADQVEAEGNGKG